MQAGIITIHSHYASENSGREGRRGGKKKQQIRQEHYTNVCRAGFATLQDPEQKMKTLYKKRFKVNGKTPSPVLRILLKLRRGRGSQTTSATATFQPPSYYKPIYYHSSSFLLDFLTFKKQLRYLSTLHVTAVKKKKKYLQVIFQRNRDSPVNSTKINAYFISNIYNS